MQKESNRTVQTVLNAVRHRKNWRRVVAGLMAVVVFCTTYALILPAITLEKQTYCGQDEHSHITQCYAAAPALTCQQEQADLLLHTHDSLCYDEDGALICTLPQQHVHTKECYQLTCEESGMDADESLLLMGEGDLQDWVENSYNNESAEPQTEPQPADSESAEETLTASVDPGEITEDMSDKLAQAVNEALREEDPQQGENTPDSIQPQAEEETAGPEETQPTEEPEDAAPADGEETDGEESAAPEEPSEIPPAQPEETGAEESAAPSGTGTSQAQEPQEIVTHVHYEGCYDLTGDPLCEVDAENVVTLHTHTGDCCDDDGKLVCEKQELALHTHSEDCYDEEGTLICEKPQVSIHQHTAACLTTEEALACGEDAHQHEDQCYQQPESLAFTYEDELVSGVITIPWSEDLPNDLTCTVVALSEEEENYGDMLASVDRTLSENSMTRQDIQLYQLEWTSGDEIYTLPEGVEATVDLTLLADFSDLDESISIQGIVLSDTAVEEEQTLQAEEAAAEEEAQEQAAALEEAADKALTEESTPMLMLMAYAAAADIEDDNEDSEVPQESSIADPEETTTVLVDPSTNEENQTTISLNVRKNAFGVAALSKAAEASSTGYYRRVTDLADLKKLVEYNEEKDAAKGHSKDTSWNKFVFVFVNGMYALQGITNEVGGYSANPTRYPEFQLNKVEVQEVPGNPEYVTIKAAGSDTVYSPSTMSLANYTIQTPHGNTSTYGNSAYSVYVIRAYGGDSEGWLYMRGGSYARAGYSTATGKFSDGIRFEYDSALKVFHMYTSEYGYLSTNIDPPYSEYDSIYGNARTADGELDSIALRTNNETATVEVKAYLTNTSQSAYDENNSEMMIYVYEENPDLTIPDISSTSTSHPIIVASKPNYTYSSEGLSDAQNGTDEDYGYSYSSDEATSNIESLFTGPDMTYEEQKKNDGRVATDKTVVYGADDYSAFSSYDADEFSVTLSALGQEWTVSEEETVNGPIDVMFLLDFSGSMTASAGNGKMRWQATIDATNKAISAVMENNEDNRVGVVCFSNSAVTLMELGQYGLDDSQTEKVGYITYSGDDHSTVATSPALAYKATSGDHEGEYLLYKQRSAYVSGIWQATYTQLGLQQVYNEFAEASTTVTKTLNNGETVEVSRKPVIIYLSDGEPTWGSYNYMDPANGPKYGIGTSGENATLGYYTILSANYFKNMTSNHYGNQAVFYTVGIGVYEEGNGSFAAAEDPNHKTSYYADDAYRRALLYPSDENIDALNKSAPTYSYTPGYNNNTDQGMTIAWRTASQLLYTLLKGKTSPSDYIQNIEDKYQVSGTYYATFYEQWLRAITNPFEHYNYADDCEFYGYFTVDELTKTFTDIVESTQLINNYGFLLKDDSTVTITDPIGEGMQVTGDMVLSYYGNLYRNPDKVEYDGYVEYTWTDAYAIRQESDSKGKNVKVDLSQIKARVYTDENGKQTVQFIIPEDAMPTLYPDLHKNFYYEELPVRLIYKVGLAEGAEQNTTYYTNTYKTAADGTKTSGTTVTFTPDDSNPYYASSTNGKTDTAKTENTTVTSPYVFQETVNTDANTVTQTLGNNGKLTVKPTITLTKEWGEDTKEGTSVTVWVYRQKQYVDQDGTPTGETGDLEKFTDYTLTSGGWTKKLPLDGNGDNNDYGGTDKDGTYVYQYYAMESLTDMAKYVVTFTDKNGNPIDYVTYAVDIGGTTYSSVRLYPISGEVTITNSANLIVKKTWADNDVGANEVKVDVYQVKTPMNGGTSTVTYFDTLTLKPDDWTATISNVKSYGFEFGSGLDINVYYYDYYIQEQPVDNYTAQYTDSDGNEINDYIYPDVVQVTDGPKADYETPIYLATGTTTITNTKTPGTISVTKEWGDGNDSHSNSTVEVFIVAQMEKKKAGEEEPSTVYVEMETLTLSQDTQWVGRWEVPYDVGSTITKDDITYTVVNYFIAELSSPDSNYVAIYYKVNEDGTRTNLTEHSLDYPFACLESISEEEGISFNKDRPYKLYPASECMAIKNVPSNQLTVTKTWAEGTYPEPVTVGIYPQYLEIENGKGYSSTENILSQDKIDKCIITDVNGDLVDTTAWKVELSEENGWTYTWKDLPTKLTIHWLEDDKTETYDVTYFVHEEHTEATYMPVYTDSEGNEITQSIRYSDKGNDFDYAVLRPKDGIVNIENQIRSSDLVIKKVWSGVDEANQTEITVNIYREKFQDGKPIDAYELYQTVTLSAEDGWTKTIENLPYYSVTEDEDGTVVATPYCYLVLEDTKDNSFTATYYKGEFPDANYEIIPEQLMTVNSSGEYELKGTAYRVPFYMPYGDPDTKQETETDIINHQESSYTVTIVNTATYTLPNAGGTGTLWYTLCGMFLLGSACTVYMLGTRRKPRRGRGGGR